MKYPREEIKEELLLEMLVSQEEKKISNKLNELIIGIVDDHVGRFDDKLNHRIAYENLIELREKAIKSCRTHVLNFKTDIMKERGNAYSYVSIIIRCSFARNLKKLLDEKRKTPTVARATAL